MTIDAADRRGVLYPVPVSAKISAKIPIGYYHYCHLPDGRVEGESRLVLLNNDSSGVYLKYALFCRDTAEGGGAADDLSCLGIIDLVDIALPDEPPPGDGPRVLAEVDANLVFCIAGAAPGSHTLEISIRAPGASLSSPPPQQCDWADGIFFQRWIKPFRIPVTRLGRHIAAIAFDGMPLGEASFLVRLRP